MIGINRVNVGGHFTHLILTHSLSSSDWFELLRGSFRFVCAAIVAIAITVAIIVAAAVVAVATVVTVVATVVAVVTVAIAAVAAIAASAVV